MNVKLHRKKIPTSTQEESHEDLRRTGKLRIFYLWRGKR